MFLREKKKQKKKQEWMKLNMCDLYVHLALSDTFALINKHPFGSKSISVTPFRFLENIFNLYLSLWANSPDDK